MFHCFISFMPLECSLHFDIAVVRGQKVGADQQEDHRGTFQTGINGLHPIGTRDDLAIMPSRDASFTFEHSQMGMQFLKVWLILAGIGVEDLWESWQNCAER